MKTLTWQKPGQQNVAQELIKIIINYVAELRIKNITETEPETKPHCSLTIIPEEEENILPKRFEYEGNSIILNRENTEMSNRTITSKEQAEIVFDDGHWYLLDRSMLQTTYIQVNRKIEIIPDDIIVLGDRRFKFECD